MNSFHSCDLKGDPLSVSIFLTLPNSDNTVSSDLTAAVAYAAITSKLNEYFKEKRNINSLRNELFSMKPTENETTRQWMERCKVIAEQCELDSFSTKEAMLLVMCQYTPIKKLRKEIMIKDLGYDQALTYAVTLERSAKEDELMTSQYQTTVNKVKKSTYNWKKLTEDKADGNCTRCGRKQPHDCRALNVKCHKCERKGHFAAMCRTAAAKQVEQEDGEQLSEDELQVYKLEDN